MDRLRNPALIAAAVIGVIALVAILAAAADLFTSWWGALALASALGAVLAIASWAKGWVPSRAVLEIDLANGIVEQTPTDPIGRLTAGNAYPLRDLVDALQRAAEDKRVVGLVARIESKDLGVARAQELASAIRRFTNAGKPAIGYAETLGEFSGSSLAEMSVAAAFDEFYLQPASDLSVTGMSRLTPYLGGMFAKGDINPDFDHRFEYKAAKYVLTEDHMPPPAREATGAVVEDQFDQLVDLIAEDRNLSRDRVVAAINKAPLLANEAKTAGMVDDLLYRDEVMKRIDDGWGAKAKRMPIAKYLKKAGRPNRRGDTIALIYGTGAVTRGSSRFEPTTRQPSMGSDEVAAAFRKAVKNKKVKAIVFRIDSPGGSAVASETIWRETQNARTAGKPVIATMGDLAGSGGYYVACGCDKIVALPGTITGSIGVVSGKLVTKGAWAKLGINFDGIQLGDTAGFGSSQSEFNEAERERLNAQLDTIYHDFVGRVAEGRSMDREEVHAVAKGRIWSGYRAKEHGLVDELGGINEAVGLAREAAGLGDKVKVQVFPKKKSPVAAMAGRKDKELHSAFGAILEMTAPLAEIAAQVRTSGVLTMPGFRAKL